jgi:hypothetical protein
MTNFGEVERDRQVALDVLLAVGPLGDRWKLISAALEREAAGGDEACANRLARLHEQGLKYAIETWLRHSVEPLAAVTIEMPAVAMPARGGSESAIVTATVPAPPRRKGPGFIPMGVQNEDGSRTTVRIPIQQARLPTFEIYAMSRINARRHDYAADLAVVAF